jgi:cellulose synthase/poly-beta-1,6-N-acetylglucosamine synthase-like glycosyltransferase
MAERNHDDVSAVTLDISPGPMLRTPQRSAGSTAAAAPRLRLRWWWPLGAAAICYGGLFAHQMAIGTTGQALDSPGSWGLALLLHLPYLLILVMLAFGLLERIGFYWRGRTPHQPGRLPMRLPKVCIQLPMFNEQAVASRIIEAAAAIRWPRELLVIQVLDDSTDEGTRKMVLGVCARVRERTGISCTWIHRPIRTGYKAGALEHGRQETDAEFIAIFDADFVPPPDYLERALPHFYDAAGRCIPSLALVQAQWGHLNDDESLLTGAQALWVDDHHSLQQSWRSANIDWVNFTGTAGVWRASAIEAVGGWRSASLVEDCELSVRALLHGYRSRFIRQLAVPAELPQTLAAYRLQQKRWTQGWAQLQRLHLRGLVFDYRTHWARKAFLVYLACISWQWPLWTAWTALLPFLMAKGLWLGSYGTEAALLVYLAPPLLFALLAGVLATAETRHGQGSNRGSFARRCARLLPYLVINTGMVPHHFCAFLEGLFGPMHAEFERTPKTASATAADGTTGPTARPNEAGPATAPAPAASRSKSTRMAYLTTEATLCAAQGGWIIYFISQGMSLAVVGAAWVLACVVGLRLAPAASSFFRRRQRINAELQS